MFNNAQFISASIGSFLVQKQAPILTTWCNQHGVKEIPFSNRKFYLMVLEKATPTAEGILNNSEVALCQYSFKLEANKVIETTTSTEVCDLEKDPIDKAITKETFVSGAACGLTIEEIFLDKDFQKDLILSQKSIDQNTLDMNRIMNLPREEFDLQNNGTGWFYSQLSTNIMNNTPSRSGLLLNTGRAFKITTECKHYNSSLLAQVVAIDAANFNNK